MKVRFDEDMAVIRSVGEDVPGIVIMRLEEGESYRRVPKLAVSGNWEPPLRRPEGEGPAVCAEIRHVQADEIDAVCTTVDADEVVAGCGDRDTALAVWSLVCDAFDNFNPTMLAVGLPEELEPWVELLVTLRDAIDREHPA